MEDFPLIWHLASVPPHNNNNQYKDSSSMDRRSQAFSDKLQRCSSILNMKGGKLKATTMDINQVNLRTPVCLGNEEVGHTRHVNEEWQQLGCLTVRHQKSILPISNSFGDDSKRCQQKFFCLFVFYSGSWLLYGSFGPLRDISQRQTNSHRKL